MFICISGLEILYIEDLFRCNYKEVLSVASQFYRESKIIADLFGTSQENIEAELKSLT
jgi:hypothetical protein